MSVRKFFTVLCSWMLLCGLVLEPLLLSPWFDQSTTMELVANWAEYAWSDAGPGLAAQPASTSMDYFRLLCLVYLGLPIGLYFVALAKHPDDESNASPLLQASRAK